MDIFSQNWDERFKKDSPLARRMAPRSLDEFMGQEHLVGENKPLRRVIEEDLLSSLLFYGPPGTGKTALARIVALGTKARFIRLNAVTAGVKDVRAVMDDAKKTKSGWGKKTVLFIDEIHRFNKVQQDTLLPAVEEGLIYLIGATTENPFFSIIPPLLSRSLLFTFESLSPEAVEKLLIRALEDEERGLGDYKVCINKEALDYLVQISDGDARAALNALEMAVKHNPDLKKTSSNENHPRGLLTLEQVKDTVQRRSLKYDPDGDYHYNIISAFIKSIRGSDPDAALYWLARMLESGEDPLFIARRIIISASEDIGNADPQALTVAVAASWAVQQLGMPEGRIPLAQAVTYLASAPKSNAAYLGINEAITEVNDAPNRKVPSHLLDASYKGASKLEHGKGYLYPHDFPGHFVPQHYLPGGMEGKRFYRPGDQGCEKEIKERLLRWRSLMGKEGE
ncbi:MAG: replication-associated recombination protein A [Bacillota bacterium]|nr:replication-associated recombination protein A [Bacillota bacterium]